MKDDRFSAMFQNPDFQVDTESEEYKLLNPVVSKLDKQRMKKHKLPPGGQQFEEVEVTVFCNEVWLFFFK